MRAPMRIVDSIRCVVSVDVRDVEMVSTRCGHLELFHAAVEYGCWSGHCKFKGSLSLAMV